jgi:hypothetical protein
MSGVTIRLGSGSCGSTGLGNRTTASNGAFSFSDLPQGTYCVTVVNPNPSCGGWLPTNGMQRTVNLGPGENKLVIWFGFTSYIC